MMKCMGTIGDIHSNVDYNELIDSLSWIFVMPGIQNCRVQRCASRRHQDQSGEFCELLSLCDGKIGIFMGRRCL